MPTWPASEAIVAMCPRSFSIILGRNAFAVCLQWQRVITVCVCACVLIQHTQKCAITFTLNERSIRWSGVSNRCRPDTTPALFISSVTCERKKYKFLFSIHTQDLVFLLINFTVSFARKLRNLCAKKIQDKCSRLVVKNIAKLHKSCWCWGVGLAWEVLNWNFMR